LEIKVTTVHVVSLHIIFQVYSNSFTIYMYTCNKAQQALHTMEPYDHPNRLE